MYQVDEYTVSLLHFNDGLKDECGNVWQAFNGATITDAETLFNGNCLLLNGQKQFIQTNTTFDFGKDDLTIDFLLVVKSFNGSSSTPYHGICTSMSASDYKGFIFSVHSDHNFVTTSDENKLPASLNTLYHVAIVRHNEQWSVAVNGKFIPWTSAQQDKFFSDYTKLSSITLGRCYTNYDDYYSNVCISEFRISKGIARWTSDFTPPTFNNAPSNLTAVASSSKVDLSWTAVTDVNTYSIKRSTIAGGPYTIIASNVSDTNYVDNDVINETTYYYIVTAATANTESGPSNEASATPKAEVTPPSPTTDSLLRVTLIDSSDHDYQLSSNEIDSFVNWYMKHTSTDTAGYMLTKKVGIQNSKEYVAFDKIISFEVLELQ